MYIRNFLLPCDLKPWISKHNFFSTREELQLYNSSFLWIIDLSSDDIRNLYPTYYRKLQTKLKWKKFLNIKFDKFENRTNDTSHIKCLFLGHIFASRNTQIFDRIASWPCVVFTRFLRREYSISGYINFFLYVRRLQK